MKNYDTYLFDFDGTLFDTAKSLGPVFRMGFQAIGMDCKDEDALTYMHMSLQEAAKIAGVPDERFVDFVMGILKALDDESSLKMIEIFPESEEVVRALAKQGKNIGIASGNGGSHIRLVLSRFGMDDLFTAISGSDEYKNGKPSAEPILLALSKLGISGENAVYVGDSLQDVKCAENAKIDGILVDRKNEHPDFAGTKIESLRSLLIGGCE